jgi:hypothetical protein
MWRGTGQQRELESPSSIKAVFLPLLNTEVNSGRNTHPMVSWENSGSHFKLLGNAIKDNVLAEVAALIGGEDLKPDLIRSRR